ncbi:uncharacterized protein LOC120011341 isoform X2 [Tripterygium wilfordii]|uniref:uncharacterized protein LOC120011341 isoform X2 n=1 Tax=Tripterygium wilfordii TaxID=458696 RepID=UPI0018F81CA6|nr:uncharacterized protein LOC120011341 isoform X2 [Tripterygium wilfordii]
MFLIKSLIVSAFLIYSSTLFSISHGFSASEEAQNTSIEDLNEEYGVVVKAAERSDLEEEEKNSTIVLAATRTIRRDPLDHFNYYRGGWNITDSHYLASVAYTAAPLFGIALVWFVVWGLFLICACLCCCCCCRRKKSYGYSQTSYALSVVSLISCIVAAVCGSVFLFIGQARFRHSVTDTLDYIVNTALSIYDRVRNFLIALTSSTEIAVDQIALSADLLKQIGDVNVMLNVSSHLPQAQSLKKSLDIENVIGPVGVALNIGVAVILVFAILGFLFALCGIKFLVYILEVIGWILVTGTFILAGVFLVFRNVVTDTCIAMDQWVENPAAHSALSDLLPCVDNATVQTSLNVSNGVTFGLVEVVDQYITTIANQNFPEEAGPLYHNQTGPLVPLLCSPFDSNLTRRRCAPGEVDFNHAGQEWKKYVCQVSADGICTTVGRLTPTAYDQMMAAVNTSSEITSFGPFLADLVDCTTVRNTFRDISKTYCPGLRRNSFRTYMGMVIVSAAMAFSQIFWLF